MVPQNTLLKLASLISFFAIRLYWLEVTSGHVPVSTIFVLHAQFHIGVSQISYIRKETRSDRLTKRIAQIEPIRKKLHNFPQVASPSPLYQHHFISEGSRSLTLAQLGHLCLFTECDYTVKYSNIYIEKSFEKCDNRDGRHQCSTYVFCCLLVIRIADLSQAHFTNYLKKKQ